MEGKENLINVLEKVNSALIKQDYVEIKNLSNRIIHTSSIHQDPDVISVAVIIYSLSKLIERESYHTNKNWNNFYNSYIQNIEKMIKHLKENKISLFRKEVDKNRTLINKLKGNIKHSIKHVFRKAKINKASRLYEHGISMETTAKILGISQWELASYVGQTKIGDVNLGITMPVKKRIKLAQEVFK